MWMFSVICVVILYTLMFRELDCRKYILTKMFVFFRPRKPLSGILWYGFRTAAMAWFQAAFEEKYGVSELL